MSISPPSHHRCRPLLVATPPPYPLSPSPANVAVTLISLSLSYRCRPLFPTRPSPSPLSPSPTVTASFSSQQGCLEK
ncbi:hypothetical protein TIFTF001_004275 [Ficus carica]|uniref:Uncharacterized protein n=1 Tax=Ficus carica TaxID=3494 RepID=A0AA88CXH5_FICCA|nr:hypothetical protein TIFTF001_004275 [Ficus carica]